MRKFHWVMLILIVGLILRLLYSASLDASAPYELGRGDSGWYLANGYALVTGLQPDAEIITEVSTLTTPPLFLMFVGIQQAIFGQNETAIIVIRILQAVMGILTAYLGGKIAWIITHNERAEILATVALALVPSFILESAQITSETLYMLCLTAGLWAYLRGIQTPRSWRWWVIAGIAFGLSALTRAVILAFPLALVVFTFIALKPRLAWKPALAFFVVYALTIGTWTLYNYVWNGRFVLAGDGLAFIYIGAAGWDNPETVDQNLAATLQEANPDQETPTENFTDDDFLEAARITISSDPMAYIQRRVREWLGALIQPHGTVLFPGESLRDLAVGWMQSDRSISGLISLTQHDFFWPKLALYGCHFGALVLGIVGMWRTRRQWRITLPIIGFIAYIFVIHLILLALPRYFFPTFLGWWIFATCALVKNTSPR